ARIITTGSLCFTEILMSRKPCSSKSEHSHKADSTSASAVALPYLASSRGSSEPALTPMRMGTPASAAAFAISATLSSNFLMLPGFTRTAAQPASIAAKTYLGWKWMSAITGICDLRTIAGSASTSSCDGTATRTIWHPAAVSSAICCKVAFTSAVTVVVIDCTETGAPPPTGTEPTMICRLSRRFASAGGGVAGIPRLIAVISRFSLGQGDRVNDVGGDGEQGEATEYQDDHVHERRQLVVVNPTGVGLAQPGVQPRPHLLEPRDGDVPAVERQQREQVEDPNEEVQCREHEQEPRDIALPEQFATDAARAHHTDGRLGVALVPGERRPELRHLLWELLQRRERALEHGGGLVAGQTEGGHRPVDRLGRLRRDAEEADILQVGRSDPLDRHLG